jgi:ribosomal protein S17E
MGKIKSKLVKRSANLLIKEDIKFNNNFENNKKILKDNMPSKKLRNQMAGFLSKIKKQEEQKNTNVINK